MKFDRNIDQCKRELVIFRPQLPQIVIGRAVSKQNIYVEQGHLCTCNLVQGASQSSCALAFDWTTRHSSLQKLKALH